MLFRQLVLTSITQPLSKAVPGETRDAYLNEVGYRKAARRAVSRRLAFWLTGQDRFRLERIPAGTRRILWIYFGENQIGDALMDLASRSLLAQAGLQVDLLAAPVVAALFEGDPWFGRVGSEAADFAAGDYDCAIVLSNKSRPLEEKMRHFARLPWVSLHEFFTGPNFHRGAFGAQRLADLLGRTLSDAELQGHARQKLAALALTAGPDGAPGAEVALVVGGVRSDRVYEHWDIVISHLASAGHERFALVGSENGCPQARALAASAPTGVRIVDYTGRLSLAGTRAVMDATSVIACADGGLMHLALTGRCAVVPLFTAQIAPEWRLPVDSASGALRAAAGGVSNIAPDEVSRMIVRRLSDARIATAA